MQPKRPMFPHVIDSSMRSAFTSCPRKMELEYINHWKGKGKNIHLHAGGAFAHALEAGRRAFYEEGMPSQDAEALALTALHSFWGDYVPEVETTKTLDRMEGALEFYFANYPLAHDQAQPIVLPSGKRGIEFSFAVPLPIDHPVTGDPIIFAGRADMIANFAGGVYIEDDKTTSSLGATWARQWEHRAQFSGYTWAARQMGMQVDGVLVRGVSILKTKYDTQQAITQRPQWECDRWLTQFVRDVQRMIEMWQGGYWDYSLDAACAEYGGCQFQRVCKSETPEQWLPMSFERRVWDPLNRRELTPEEAEKEWDDGILQNA